MPGFSLTLLPERQSFSTRVIRTPKEPGVTGCAPWSAGADPVPVELVPSDFYG